MATSANRSVLVTCPPMLGRIDSFRDEFSKRGADVVAPPVVQALSEAELRELLPSVNGWIAGDDPVNEAVLSAGLKGRLRAVVKWGIGVDNVDFGAAARLGIPVVNTPGMFGAEVADLAVGYVVALARSTFMIDRGVRAGLWPKPAGVSLSGKRVALVGFGDVGRNVARRLVACDMRITAYDPAMMENALMPGVELRKWPDEIDLADFLVITCALTATNRHMVSDEVLRKAKPGLRLVNVARGPLIDESALVDAISSGRVAAAALDVFETEPLPRSSALRQFDQCVFGSHNASNTAEAVARTSHRAIDLLFAMLNGRT